VGGQVVHHDDVARLQPRCELLLDVGEKDVSIRRCIDRDEAAPAVDSDRTQHRHRAPIAVRRFSGAFSPIGAQP
jgi:hypothetical protein